MHRLTLISRRPVNTLEVLLKQCYASPACQKFCFYRHYATASSKSNMNPGPPSIAVLGGGITGLASAYFLSRDLPNAKITLFEASSRLGGWLHSRSVDVGSGNVVFEQGPRNLRPTMPNGLITLNLVRDLGLEDRVLMTSKNSIAAQNRFVYYPDHLVRMPGPGSSLLQNISNVLSEPIFKSTISGALFEVTKPQRPRDLQDESIGSFLTRRFGSALADNVVSAVFHGIYAGDIYKLSARAIVPSLWAIERRNNSIILGLLDQALGGKQPIATSDLDMIKALQSQPCMSHKLDIVKKSSVFTFKGGIGELADRLEAKLDESNNVLILENTDVRQIKLGSNTAAEKIQINAKEASNRETTDYDFDHVVSTISGNKLASIASRSPTTNLSPLSCTSAVTVMVVNLFYSNPNILPVHGFGYLLPRSVPFEQNPERALGVVFDSDASIGQDDVPGTKVTVMLGGHWWDDFDAYPDEDEGASMAKALLNRHLGIDEKPRAIRVSLQRDCIPQYGVGHEERMEDASRRLESFKGRLRVAGNSYTGVGLNDCIRAARDVVTGLVDNTGRTGLESFVGGKKWSWLKQGQLKS